MTWPVNAEPTPPLLPPHGRMHAVPSASYCCRLFSHGGCSIGGWPGPADDLDCWLIDS